MSTPNTLSDNQQHERWIDGFLANTDGIAELLQGLGKTPEAFKAEYMAAVQNERQQALGKLLSEAQQLIDTDKDSLIRDPEQLRTFRYEVRIMVMPFRELLAAYQQMVDTLRIQRYSAGINVSAHILDQELQEKMAILHIIRRTKLLLEELHAF